MVEPTPVAPGQTAAETPGTLEVAPQVVNEEQAPEQPAEVNVQDTSVIFVPFEDFEGRINQADFSFRKDIPTKIPKTEANVWLESKKGYIK